MSIQDKITALIKQHESMFPRTVGGFRVRALEDDILKWYVWSSNDANNVRVYDGKYTEEQINMLEMTMAPNEPAPMVVPIRQ